MNKLKKCIVFFLLPCYAFAQKGHNQFIAITGGVSNSQAIISGSYAYNWKWDKLKKWEAGIGLRLSSYFGLKKDFTTAPARLSRSNSVPFLVYFAEKQTQNIDTLTVQRPFTNSINIFATVSYNIQRWQLGFNLDLIGYTFGRTTSGILTSNGYTKTEANAKPAAFNLFLTGDNNYGTINSEFFLDYKLSNRFSIKGAYQMVTVEYKTFTITQKTPGGSIVDRFRNRPRNAGLGLVYYFK